jgi:hypothetical protein
MFGQLMKRSRDMGDGSYAEVVAVANLPTQVGADNRLPVNANLQVGDADVAVGNAVPVTPTTTRVTKTATIANGASLSGAVDLGDNVLVRIIMPAEWTTAVLTFQTSDDGVTYAEALDTYDALLSYNPLVGNARPVEPVDFLGVRYLKVRSGTAASAVNQTAERIIKLVVRPI